MTKRYDRPLTIEELRALRDEDIDYSDIAELGDQFWNNAVIVEPDGTQRPIVSAQKPARLSTPKKASS